MYWLFHLAPMLTKNFFMVFVFLFASLVSCTTGASIGYWHRTCLARPPYVSSTGMLGPSFCQIPTNRTEPAFQTEIYTRGKPAWH